MQIVLALVEPEQFAHIASGCHGRKEVTGKKRDDVLFLLA